MKEIILIILYFLVTYWVVQIGSFGWRGLKGLNTGVYTKTPTSHKILYVKSILLPIFVVFITSYNSYYEAIKILPSNSVDWPLIVSVINIIFAIIAARYYFRNIV